MSVCENYRAVEEKVRNACKKAGRSREEVTLIAVSKTKPVSMIEELLPLGSGTLEKTLYVYLFS